MTADRALTLGLYGTLLDPDVRALVFGEAWRTAGRPATLHGWERRYVQGQIYPGIRAARGSTIDVLVLADVPATMLAIADEFEGDEYARQLLPVTYADAQGGEEGAMFYVPSPAIALSNQAWSYDAAWRAAHLAEFLQEAKEALSGSRTVVSELPAT
ncbi:MAG: gamma-glutamylcyclotransferase family protein [Alphaproteobacteria bacterium]|jgi:hypothetical protein